MVLLNTLTQKNNKIAFFDSGVGGLTVYSKLKHLPYGNKTQEELISYSRSIFNFFKSQNVKAVVIACNTSSAATYSTMVKEFDFKIYPIIQSCANILANLKINKLGIFATESTINSGVYSSEIHKYNKDIEIFSQSCPQWVNIVESKTIKENENTIKKNLDEMLKNNPDKIVLGCTHYPYLLETLSKFDKIERFIDPAEYFVEFIKSDLKKSNLLNEQNNIGSEEFYVSANPEQFKSSAKMFYSIQNAKKIDLN
jgi:glutamate racemase